MMSVAAVAPLREVKNRPCVLWLAQRRNGATGATRAPAKSGNPELLFLEHFK
jgi:hypothetical protein